MTRRVGWPIAMLIVLMQILLPVLTVRAAADVPVGQKWVICSARDAGQAPQGVPHHHDGLCPVCQFCGVAPLFVSASVPTVPVTHHFIVVTHAPEFYVLARGPPQARPRARAPPAIS
jgi:hypothetical protein